MRPSRDTNSSSVIRVVNSVRSAAHDGGDVARAVGRGNHVLPLADGEVPDVVLDVVDQPHTGLPRLVDLDRFTGAIRSSSATAWVCALLSLALDTLANSSRAQRP